MSFLKSRDCSALSALTLQPHRPLQLLYSKAIDLKNETKNITDDGIRTGIQSGKEINLFNLINESGKCGADPAYAEGCNVGTEDPRFIQARMRPQEVSMRRMQVVIMLRKQKTTIGNSSMGR